MTETDKLYLGIETSCDETACAVVRGDGEALSNIVASQFEVHAPFGGVVPELASRAHVRNMLPIYRGALEEAGVGIHDISAIAVTRGPGLVGSLLVGFETAKAFGMAHDLPVFGIHHIAAHAHSPFVHGKGAGGSGFLPAGFDYPFLALVVSGGHTSLLEAASPHRFVTIGSTRDDAVGEAYDKVARFLGLGYPGGPPMDRLAAKGDPAAFPFTRPRLKNGEFDFSFSGLKSAVARLAEKKGMGKFQPDAPLTADLAASFQACAIEALLEPTQRLLETRRIPRLAVVGGVACNRGLRAETARRLAGVSLVFPPPTLCTDNAAMIAGLAAALGEREARVEPGDNVDANLPL